MACGGGGPSLSQNDISAPNKSGLTHYIGQASLDSAPVPRRSYSLPVIGTQNILI